jgi:hypothetical protein
MAPVATLLFWSLSLGVAAGLGLPIKNAAPVLWGVSGLLAVYGLWRRLPDFRSALPLVLCAALPVVVMARPFAFGLTQECSTVALDGWTYMAGGHYVWGHARGDGVTPAADLSLLDRVGASFNGQRYLSFTFLAYFSPLVRAGDTCSVAALHQAWTLFSLAAAVFLFWIADGQGAWRGAAATAVALLGGWIATAVWGNNFDQLLALVYMPATAAAVRLWGAHDRRRWLLLGGLLAGSWYAYPECAPFVLGGAALIVMPQLWTERRSWRAWVLGCGASLFVAVLLLLPAAATLFRFAQHQYAEVLTGTRQIGYEMYRGLLNPAFQPAAFWGLGGETYAKPHTGAMRVWAVALSALLTVGLFALVRRGRWGIAMAIVFLLGGGLFFLLVHPYPYAAFKVLSMAWWCVAGALVLGATAVLGSVPSRLVRRSLAAGLILAGVYLVACNQTQKPLWPSNYNTLAAATFRQVRLIRKTVARQPVMIAVADWLPNLLAIYHLRELPLEIGSPRAWLQDPDVVRSTGIAGEVSPPGVRYVLTDDNPTSANSFVHYGRLVWARPPYKLWELEPAGGDAVVIHIDNPYGLGRSEAGDSMWLGPFDTTLYVRVQRPGVLRLEATFRPGPNLPGREAQLRLGTGAGYSAELTIAEGWDSLAVPVRIGINRIVLRPLDPAAATPTGSDPRTLLLQVIGLRTSLAPAAAP